LVRHIRRLGFPAFALILPVPASAQAVQEIPNAMAAHTRFIIIIMAAFLAWAVSFSLLTMKERNTRQKQRQALVERRERILDEIAELEIGRESGEVAQARYSGRSKSLRNDLARVLERLERPTGKQN
jgi:hypothetical protein